MSIFIYIAIFAVIYLSLMYHDVHMFQQNSYRLSRYARWWKGSNTKALNLIYCACLCVAQRVDSLAFKIVVLSIIVLVDTAPQFKRPKQKTPLVYTSRVKRLIAVNLMLATLASWFGVVLLPEEYVYVFAGVLLLSPAIMLLANVVLMPIERTITQWYINDARKILASHKDLIIIGVTGSYGKTSTKNYLYRMLCEKYNVLVTPGNFNTLLGVVRTVREHLRPQHQVFIVEMGAKQQGDIAEICELVHPSIGIVSSVGEAHLETFKSVENIQRTKFELIASLPSDGLGVINFDSQSIRDYKFESKASVKSYAVDNKSDFMASNVAYNSTGVAFTMSIDDESIEFKSPLLGGGNVLNLMAGIVVARHLGVDTHKIARAMKQLQPVEHRLSMSRAGGLTILDDAYNSNPTGAKMALDVLRDFTRIEGAQRIIITPGFVEMGTRQYDANYQLGREIALSVDYAVVVNLHNREAINKGLCDAGFSENKIFLADSLAVARQHLATRLKVGDVVLYENDLPDSFK